MGMPDDAEISKRVAVLKRLRALLEQQRRAFREYLTVLEKQEAGITVENADAVMQHTELEQSILDNIGTIQKVIDPLEYMYLHFCNNTQDSDILRLKTDLDNLQKRVVEQNKKNCALLQTHMNGLRTQLVSLKRPYAHRESVYAGQAEAAALVDVSL